MSQQRTIPHAKLFTLLAIFLFIFLIQSCESTRLSSIVASNSLSVYGVIFKNISNQPIERVSLKVDATNKYISCSRIASQQICSTTFPLKEYKKNTLTIHWKQAGKDYFKKNFTVDIEKNRVKSIKYTLVITLKDNGHVTTQFMPS